MRVEIHHASKAVAIGDKMYYAPDAQTCYFCHSLFMFGQIVHRLQDSELGCERCYRERIEIPAQGPVATGSMLGQMQQQQQAWENEQRAERVRIVSDVMHKYGKILLDNMAAALDAAAIPPGVSWKP